MCQRLLFIFRLFFVLSSISRFFDVDVATWDYFSCASWSDFCKICKMMRSFTNKSTMSIFCETTITIFYFETSIFFFTRRNALFWLSWCFWILNDWSLSRFWKILLTANTRASVLDEDKAFVLTVNLTCAREAILSEFWVLMRSFLNSSKVFESREVWLIFFTDFEIVNYSFNSRLSFLSWFENSSFLKINWFTCNVSSFI
jgi:hypothetical protein